MNEFDQLILEGILGQSGNPYEPVNRRGYSRWNGSSKYKEYVWYGMGQSLSRRLTELKRDLSIRLIEESDMLDLVDRMSFHSRTVIIQEKVSELERRIDKHSRC